VAQGHSAALELALVLDVALLLPARGPEPALPSVLALLPAPALLSLVPALLLLVLALSLVLALLPALEPAAAGAVAVLVPSAQQVMLK